MYFGKKKSFALLGASGSTLIELLISLAILGILSAIAVVHLRHDGGARQAESALEQIEQDLIFAKEWAKTSGREAYFVIDATNNRYKVVDNQGELLEDARRGRVCEMMIGVDKFRGLRITSSDFAGSALWFDRTGAMRQGNGVITGKRTVIVLNDRYRVMIMPGTGDIETEIY